MLGKCKYICIVNKAFEELNRYGHGRISLSKGQRIVLASCRSSSSCFGPVAGFDKCPLLATQLRRLALGTYLLKTLNDKIQDNKQAADQDLQNLAIELKQTHRKDDALREIDRLDKDLLNLRNDISKNFDVVREQRTRDKDELIRAIESIRS